MGNANCRPYRSDCGRTIIAVNAVGLFRENMSYLLGRAPSKDVMTQLENFAFSVPGVLAVHDLRAAYIGPNAVHTDIHIVVAPNLTVVEAHDIAKEVENLLKPLLGNGTCTIHVDANMAGSPEATQQAAPESNRLRISPIIALASILAARSRVRRSHLGGKTT